MDKDRKEYVSNVCARFISDYVMQLDNFQSKGKSGRQFRLNKIVLIHDEDTKRLMWSTRLVSFEKVVTDSSDPSCSEHLMVTKLIVQFSVCIPWRHGWTTRKT
jgi:hypothetical protein